MDRLLTGKRISGASAPILIDHVCQNRIVVHAQVTLSTRNMGQYAIPAPIIKYTVVVVDQYVDRTHNYALSVSTSPFPYNTSFTYSKFNIYPSSLLSYLNNLVAWKVKARGWPLGVDTPRLGRKCFLFELVPGLTSEISR